MPAELHLEGYAASGGLGDVVLVLQYTGYGLTVPDTAKVTVLKVDLGIANGQGGSLLDEDKEETPGAFTVANLNDTDGDATIDKDDGDVSATANGTDEVDLMRILLHKPEPDLGDKVKLKVVSGDVKIWQQSKKVTQVTLTGGAVEFNTSDLDKTLWVEARSKSGALRDIALELEYKGCKDAVKATGVWGDTTQSIHNTGDTYTIWTDITTPPKDRLDYFGGAIGLRPIDAKGVRNVIAVQFTVYPSGIGNETGVKFDLTRRKHRGSWYQDGANPVQADIVTWPTQNEEANDDPIPEIDESSSPTATDHMYVEDVPGLGSDVRFADWFIYRGNFQEYLRVRFDNVKPSGNTLEGSRCSPNYQWHGRHKLVPDGTKWKRSTGDDPESDENDIAPGHITVGTSP
jgi:hypothetical protein